MRGQAHTAVGMTVGFAAHGSGGVPHPPSIPLSDRSPAMSYTLYYTNGMADTITFRPDEDAARALEVLTKDGTPVSTAVRTALIDAARRLAAARLHAEAEQLAADEQDRAEAAQVLRDMETLRAW
jgi:hypothetical protein